ncbi:hypothetical protein Tco_0461179 [Tanacetum coccineum]
MSDAEDFGPTTEKDGQDCSCNVEQRVPEMITGMESYQGKAVQYWDHIRLKQVHMYLRGSGKVVEMKHDAAISTMMAAFQQAMNNGHRNCASHIGAQI